MLDFADNQVDPTTGTIQVRGVVPNPDGRFVAGLERARADPVSDDAQAVLRCPTRPCSATRTSKYLLVVDDKNVVQRRDIGWASCSTTACASSCPRGGDGADR